MPQAASAHDTFWDFVSLMPESTHMLMWVMSDRAIPRSYRMMQGFGVHTFRFVNAEGESRFVKFHWNPTAGTHSLVWDEAVKISGADPDFHRRDLWEAIEAGAYPEWELGVQIFTEREAEKFQLRRARCDQAHSGGARAGDAGRPNGARTAIPTTSSPRPSRSRSAPRTSCRASTSATIRCSPAASTPTSTRRSRGSAVPTSTRSRSTRRSRRCTTTSATACTGRRFRAVASPTSRTRSAAAVRSRRARKGFMSFPQPIEEHKVRGKPEKFAEHYNQATLFWKSQSDVEKAHIVRAFRFELTKVQTVAVRERVVAQLRNVAEELAERVADGLGMRAARAVAEGARARPASRRSSFAGAVAARAAGRRTASRRGASRSSSPTASTASALRSCTRRSPQQGAVPRFVGVELGRVETPQRRADRSRDLDGDRRRRCCGTRSCCPTARGDRGAVASAGTRSSSSRTSIATASRSCALGAARQLLEAAGIWTELPDGDPDPGVLHVDASDIEEAVAAFVERS